MLHTRIEHGCVAVTRVLEVIDSNIDQIIDSPASAVLSKQATNTYFSNVTFMITLVRS